MYVVFGFYSGYTSEATIGGPECNTPTILPGAHAELYDSIGEFILAFYLYLSCLLYTSDAADDMQCVDLGCRRIIKKNCFRN